MAKYPVPPSDPKNKLNKAKPKRQNEIAFTPAVPTPKRASKNAQTGMEMPKQVKPKSGKVDLSAYEMPKIMGSTKAQRADSAREMLNDMRSRNLLRSRNLFNSRKKRGM